MRLVALPATWLQPSALRSAQGPSDGLGIQNQLDCGAKCLPALAPLGACGPPNSAIPPDGTGTSGADYSKYIIDKSMRYERRTLARAHHPPESAPVVRQVEAGPDDAGQRLDNYLLRQFKSVPRSRVYRLLRRGEVRVNGRRAKPDYRLIEGDRLRLPPVRTSLPAAAARVPDALIERIRQAVVHEDEVERAVQELHTAFGLDG